MSKYLELFRDAFDDSIDAKTKLENKPYIGYSIEGGKVVYTIVPKKEEEDMGTTFRFISREDDNVVDFYSNAWLGRIDDSKKQNVYIKVNNGEWVSIANQTSFTLNTGDKLYFKNDGEDLKTFYVGGSSASIGTTTKTFDVAGNVDEFMIPSGNMTSRQYDSLFAKTKVIDASRLILPTAKLASNCYDHMFCECTSLTAAPELPATTLADSCYYCMFGACTSLTTAPELRSTVLAEGCYRYMFTNCISLTIAPVLPATTLAVSCYASMFNGCTSLTTAPKILPATELASNCYKQMFYGCNSLTVAPELPATTLTDHCYSDMFSFCRSLTTAPELPATTLANRCYEHMFSSCTSLTTAPELPATELAEHCYLYMFANCTSLTTAPELPATVLADYCYHSMFSQCSSLNYIKCSATNISALDCTYHWVYGVSSKGTFIKHPDMTRWSTGTSGIPSGWDVVDAEVK